MAPLLGEQSVIQVLNLEQLYDQLLTEHYTAPIIVRVTCYTAL